jgi:hypothetical protein
MTMPPVPKKSPTVKPAYWNVTEYGAVGVARPGETLKLTNLSYKWILYPPGTAATIYHSEPGVDYDSIGIQRAIDAAHAAGGGTVVVPAGDYLIAPIQLKSRVTLHLEPGARLWGSPKLEDYINTKGLEPGVTTFVDAERPGQAGKFTSGRSTYRPPGPGDKLNLIYAGDAEDVGLTGRGEIHAQSPVWIIPWMNEGPVSWQSLDHRRPAGPVLFFNCRRVLVEGISILDSPSWTLVFSRCNQVRIHGVTIRNFDAINADGIDLVDTSNAIISDCNIHCTDDGICLKTDTRTATPPGVRNVTVTNCVIRTWCNALKLGTESTGTFEDIAFSNIVVHYPEGDLKWADGGIHIAICDGGLARNISFRGIVMRNVDCPLYLVTTRRKRHQQAFGEPRAGRVERITVAGLQADGARWTSFIVGCPGQPIRDISLADISIRKTLEFRPGPFPEPVRACAEQYPSGFMFGSPDGGRRDCGDGLPAHGLYLRDAEGVSVRGLRVKCTEPDGRPVIAHESCREVVLSECGPN